jgi:hypothetical protein
MVMVGLRENARWSKRKKKDASDNERVNKVNIESWLNQWRGNALKEPERSKYLADHRFAVQLVFRPSHPAQNRGMSSKRANSHLERLYQHEQAQNLPGAA